MNTSLTSKFTTFFLVCSSVLLGFTATQARADQGDPPSRVARISSLDGSVSIQPGGTGDWGNADRNRPVTVGDKLWSDKDSRVELRAGQASIHLGSDTALSFLNLDQNITQMRLSEGSLNFRVRELREGDLYEVDTPNLAFTVREAGAFRIDVNENGDLSGVTVIRGEGEVTAGGKTYAIHSGERGDFNGIEEVRSNIDRAPGPDDLDRWASDRDLKEDDSVSARYVSRDMAGYDDLDDYGDWRDDPDYGHVWYPRHMEADWAPYSTGYWSWVGPWGWTWVDYSPWGFAPYHYGRWSYINGGWGWCPGPIYAAPIYGPAFVGFLGGGFGFGGGFGYGVGWFPLGFGEPFCPWYRHSNTYIRNVNISNTYIRNTNIINNGTINNYNYRYAHEARAVTATTRNGFVNGQRVNRGEAHLTAASLRGAQVNTKFSVAPTPSSYLGAAHTGKQVATPPAAIISRPVVARTAPAPAASHMPVHTVNSSALTPGRTGSTSTTAGGRATGSVNANRPVNGSVNTRGSFNTNSGQAGRAPAAQSQATPQSSRQRQLTLNRPPWAGSNSTASPNRGNAPTYNGRPSMDNRTTAPNGSHPYAAPQRNAPNYNNRPPAPNGNRSYAPPQRSAPNYGNRGSSAPRSSSPPRSYSPPARTQFASRSYSAPSRGYSAPSAPPRSYSAPSRNYSAPSAPSRSYSAPSRSYSAPSAPSRSYSAPAPSRSYSAPSRSYSAPSHSSPAPSHSSGGGSGGGSHGGDNRTHR